MQLYDKGCRLKLITVFLMLMTTVLSAKEYYAKVDPYEIRTIASNVSGLVLFADEKSEGSVLGSKPYIQIDDELDQVELEKNIAKIKLLQNTLELNQKMEKNYQSMLQKKQENYDRIKGLKIKSTIEKDREFYDLISTQNQYLGILKEIENLNVQINDLKLRQAQLKRSISDKRLIANGYVLYKLLVKEGQVVTMATPLAEVADIRQAKLTLFLNAEDVENISHKVIYLNDKKTDYTISRLWNIADSTHLSSYRAEIVINAPDKFSALVKVEFKDE